MFACKERLLKKRDYSLYENVKSLHSLLFTLHKIANLQVGFGPVILPPISLSVTHAPCRAWQIPALSWSSSGYIPGLKDNIHICTSFEMQLIVQGQAASLQMALDLEGKADLL